MENLSLEIYSCIMDDARNILNILCVCFKELTTIWTIYIFIFNVYFAKKVTKLVKRAWFFFQLFVWFLRAIFFRALPFFSK
jgi:hypothetical protein